MYKRAISNAVDQRPLWYVGEGLSTFAGPLRHNQLHSHSVPVLLTGLYGTFRFRSEKGHWAVCRRALVPAGRLYEFDMAGEPLSVIYLEPTVGGAGVLAPLVSNADEFDGVLHGHADDLGALRLLYEDQSSATWAREALIDLVQAARPRERRDLDLRIMRVVRALQSSAMAGASADDAARSVGLSASRFQHLFTADAGIPFRRYRAWRRMLRAIREIVSGANLTNAAHAAGYADQAHFAREFRRTFGASASAGIAGARG
ncbi:MAG TPA: AraC family transcriptional regulator [Hyphomicrobium sp.]|nr:AraC family transcriptional regulator [Hyphomicrobium sp.]